MPQAPLTVVENAYRAWADGEFVDVLCAFHPDVRWHQDDGLHEGELVGRGALADRLRDLLGDWLWLDVTPLRITVHGSLVAVVGTYSGTRRATGFAFEDKFTHLWGVRDGRGVEIGLYRTPATAMRELDRHSARAAGHR
jgi:ketosteroid isomerase-like protein